MPRRASCRRGISLFLAIIIVATLSLMAMVALRIASDEVDIATSDGDSAQALLTAESGIAHAAAALAGNGRFVGQIAGTIELTLDPDVTDPEERYSLYTVRIADESGDGSPDTVVATGFCRGQARALRATLKSLAPVAFTGRPQEIPAEPPAP